MNGQQKAENPGLSDQEAIDGGPTKVYTNKAGKSFPLVVKEIPLSEYRTYMSAVALGDLVSELTLYSGLSTEKLDTFTQKEALRLREEGRAINADFFEQIAQDLAPKSNKTLDNLEANIAAMEQELQTRIRELATSTPSSAKPGSPPANTSSSENPAS